MNILLIEDDAASMKLARVLLATEGHEVIEAKSAEQALGIILNGALPELIMLDLKLPGMNGMSLMRLLKLEPATRHIPIVAVTAFPDAFCKDEALKAGCAAYLVKPLDTRAFAQQVAQHTARKTES